MSSAADGIRTDMAGATGFAPSHPWDRNFFLVMVLAIWAGILAGFAPEVIHYIAIGKAFPFILHVHAVVFVGWLILLTTQVLLVRVRNLRLHRRLGLAGVGLAVVMLVVGPATAVIMNRLKFGAPDADTPFLIVQMTDMLCFGILAGAGLLLRKSSPAHKRLMLIATLCISDAGFSRWVGGPLDSIIGHTAHWAYFLNLYLVNDLLMLGIGAYDLVTRRRLHPAYLAAITFVAAIQVLTVWIRLAPEWEPLAARLLGR